MNFFRTIVLPSLNLLGSKYRRSGVFLLPLLLLQSILDVLSVASLAPMALLIVRPESIMANPFLLNLYETFSFTNEHYFALAWAVAIAVFFILKHGISILITGFKARYAFGVSAFLSQRMLDHFINLRYAEYHDLQSSHEQVKVANLPISFANNILLGLATLITEGLILVLLLISLVIYDWRSVLFLMIIIFPAVVYYRIIRKKLNDINHSLRTNFPSLIHRLQQLFENFIEINLYQKRKYFIKKVQALNDQLHQTQVLQTILQANSFRLFETTAAVGLCFLVLYTLVAQTSADETVMLLGLYTAAGFRAVPSFNRIFVSFLQIKTNEHVLIGLSKFETQREESGSAEPVHFNTSLELRDISFGFAHKPELLGDVNLRIAKGQRVALTGPSGSGKTTLLLVIMRFLLETKGEILIDGIALRDHQTGAWRKRVAYVSQHPVILDGSVIENVAFGVDPEMADKEKILELIRILDLGTWLSQLPHGLMTRFGERGIKLSGGQRQRLAIARALYTDAEILLFDEATSQVDSITEKDVHEALKTVAHQNKTLIMVTHRETSLQFFDKVFHLEHGQILETVRDKSHA